MNEKIYCKSGGCSAKLGAKKLSHILEKIDSYKDSHVLVGFDSRDDAAVYQIDENHAFVSTLDFFPPMVEDPYLYGQIAATNALSDIYAMNGTPKTALNIVCFPDNEDLNILGKIIEGGNSKLVEAECALAGGHSIRDDSIKYGLSVTGLVNPKDVKKNNGTQCGDVLILTKPLGVGLTLNALRMDDCSKEMQERVFKSMTTLNKYACDVLKKYDVHIRRLILCGPPTENSAASLGLALAKIIKPFYKEKKGNGLLNKMAFAGYESGNRWLSKCVENVEQYEADELCGFLFTTNGFINLFQLMIKAFDKKGWNVTNENLHIFMIAGQEDPVIQGKDKFEQLKQFLMGVGYKNVSSKLYPTLKHEILNEKENQIIYEDIYEFIKSAKD